MALLVAAATIAAQTDSPESLRESGLAHLREGRFGQAADAYRGALDLAPDREILYLELADVFLGAGLPDEAEGILNDATGRFTDSPSPHYNLLYHDLAELWIASGRLGKAREAMEEASRREGPLDAAVIWKRLGDLDTDLLRFDAALAAYRRSLEMDPGNTETRLALGRLHLRRNSLEEAAAEFTRLLEAGHSSPGALAGLAEVHWRRGNYADAARVAEEALRLSPTQRGALYIRGASLLRLGRESEAEPVLEEYRHRQALAQAEDERQRDIQTFRSGGMALLMADRPDEAVELLASGLEVYPDSPALYLSLGQAQSESGRHRDAIATFERWLDSGLDDPRTAHRYLAREYAEIGNTEAGARHRALAEAAGPDPD